jgi:hypothetical protein
MWTLTYSVDGQKQVEIIPKEAVRALKPLVKGGRELRNAVGELLTINAQLLRLRLKEQRGRARPR